MRATTVRDSSNQRLIWATNNELIHSFHVAENEPPTLNSEDKMMRFIFSLLVISTAQNFFVAFFKAKITSESLRNHLHWPKQNMSIHFQWNYWKYKVVCIHNFRCCFFFSCSSKQIFQTWRILRFYGMCENGKWKTEDESKRTRLHSHLKNDDNECDYVFYVNFLLFCFQNILFIQISPLSFHSFF